MRSPTLLPLDRSIRAKELARKLRQLADKVENGEVAHYAIVFDNLTENKYELSDGYDNKWHLIGALEYTKHMILEGY